MKEIISKEVYVAWTNTDLTEGRGWEYPLYVCETETTAKRLGYKGSVQGCNCRVTKEEAIKYNGMWLVPGRVIIPTKEDLEVQKKEDTFNEVLSKAKASGLSEADIKILKGV